MFNRINPIPRCSRCKCSHYFDWFNFTFLNNYYYYEGTPGGVLLFLPSYGLLDKLKERWTQSGLLSHISDNLSIGVWFEPREGKSMSQLMDNYYADIDAGNKSLLVAVCRGKISEGINFSDQV